MNADDEDLSRRISPLGKVGAGHLRTLLVYRLRQGGKAVLRRALRFNEEFSHFCEYCKRWIRWGDTEPPFEWICPSCDGLYRMEFAVYYLVERDPDPNTYRGNDEQFGE